MDESQGLKVVYEKKISAHLDGKVVDYHTAPREGFSITGGEPSPDCNGCSCD